MLLSWFIGLYFWNKDRKEGIAHTIFVKQVSSQKLILTRVIAMSLALLLIVLVVFTYYEIKLLMYGLALLNPLKAFSVDKAANENYVADQCRDLGITRTPTNIISKLYGLKVRTRIAVVNASIMPEMMEAANMTVLTTMSWILSLVGRRQRCLMITRKNIRPLRNSLKQLKIIFTITIISVSRRKQNGCLLRYSGKHPYVILCYSLTN